MTPHRPISELLPWLFLSEGRDIVVNKDSSLMAVYAIRGIDEESADEFGLENAGRIHDEALRTAAQMPVRVWHRIDRYAVTDYRYGAFDNPMAREIDRLWGASFESGDKSFDTSATISFAMATARNKRALMDLARERMDQGESAASAFARGLVDRFRTRPNDVIGFSTAEDLDSALQRFEQNVLRPMQQKMHHIEMERLTDEMLCGYLKASTSATRPHEVEYNPFTYLDAALADTWIDNRDRDHLVFEGQTRRFASVLTLKTAPPGNRLGKLNSLLTLPIELSIGSCWTAISQKEAIKELRAARTFDELSRMNIKSMLRAAIANSTELMESDSTPTTEVGVAAMAAVEGVQNNEAAFGFMTCSIVVYADELRALKRNVELVENTLANSGLVFLREREGSLSGYAATIPGNVSDPARWFHVEAGNVTDLAPLVTLATGEANHPLFSTLYARPMPPAATLRSRNNTNYHFNNHIGELGHTLILGPSRNGKTMLQMFLESQGLKYPFASFINFDKDYSCEAPTLLHGGTTLDLTPGAPNGVHMNPLAYLKSPGGVTWCAGWIDRLMSLRGARLTAQELDSVNAALQSLTNMSNVRLTTLNTQLPKDMQDRLSFWCEGGMYGEYFDNPDDELSFDTITTFELGGLMARGNNDVLRAFTDYVFFRIQDRFQKFHEGVGPTNVYFEEAGFILEDPLFEERAVDYLMTLAKMKAFLTMTAQSPEAFVRSKRLQAAVRDNVATVIFLPNDKANRGELAQHYQTIFGLNRHHLDLIASATPRREYCVWQPQINHFRVAVAHFPPSIVARLRSDRSSRKVLNEVYEKGNPTWRQKYIDAVGAL